MAEIPTPKLFSLFNRKPPSISVKTTTTININGDSSTSSLPIPNEASTSNITSINSTSIESTTSTVKAVNKSRASSPTLTKKNKKIKRKLGIDSDEDEERKELPKLNGSAIELVDRDAQMIIEGVKIAEVIEKNEVVSKQEEGQFFSTIGSSKGKEKAKEFLNVDEEDNDVVIIESSSKKSTKSILNSNTSSPKRRKLNSSTKASTSNLPTTITIPDSPPLKASRSLSFGTNGGFLPLSEIYRSSREKRLANEPKEALWPSEEEHGFQHQSMERRSIWESNERWSSVPSLDANNEGKGKGKERAVEANENVKLQLLQSLTVPIPNLSSHSIPRTKFVNAPNLYYHPLYTVKEMLPPSLPSHPLLNRLSQPFLVEMPHPASFIRIHDRDNDDVMNQEGSSEVNFKDMWTVKYAPKSASEVLGTTSGESAKLLKDWLEELALANGVHDDGDEKKRKPRKINRDAFKPKSKRSRRESSDDGWIVDDFAEDYISSEDEEEDSGLNRDEEEDYVPRPQIERNHRITFPILTNLILLYGPTSSGKTLTVHAVANELGWEVFEVYPGIGKRSNKDIERYVGDVGKNHLILGGSETTTAKDPFSMFKSAKIPSLTTQVEATTAKTRQSLILFDEVDILYKEDKEFWTGLTNLVKECKRPIILTCSELSNIPAIAIGLQEVVKNNLTTPYLRFEAPEPAIAIPFLRLVSLSEGYIVPESTISNLYNNQSKVEPTPYTLFQYDGITEPRFGSTQPLPLPDLRQALTQLQFDSQWALGESAIAWMDFTPNRDGRTAWSVPHSTEKVTEVVEMIQVENDLSIEDALEREVLSLEILSAMDAFISPRNITIIEQFEPEANQNHNDTPVNYALLLEAPLHHSQTQLPQSKNTEEIVSYLSTTSFKYRNNIFQKIDKFENITINNKLQSQLSLAHTMLIPSYLITPENLHRLSHPADIFLYYLPCLRAISQVDDMKEIIFNAEEEDEVVVSTSSRSRGLRRSNRLGEGSKKFNRNIPWLDGVVEKVRESGF